MRRIVLDTNCLLQALPSLSPYHKVWKEILEGTISLCVNTEILEEYEEILSKKMSSDIAKNVVETIAHLPRTYYQEIYVHFELISEDRDDNKFVDCAIAADAEYIVTNDNHFNILKTVDWPKIVVVRIKDFVEEILG